MGCLREINGSRNYYLYPENLIGRSPMCTLRLMARWVSGQHSVVAWTGTGWAVKDLSSRNGTFVEGHRITAGENSVIRQGTKLSFGQPTEEWELVDESPPVPMAVPLDGGAPALIEGDLLPLPSAQMPLVTIYRNSEGHWLLEGADGGSSPMANMQTLEVGGRLWTFTYCEGAGSTMMEQSVVEVPDVHLTFAVSRDEEHVQLAMRCRGKTVDLGARNRHYLLLTLARRRIADAEKGLPEPACGWISQEELEHDPSMVPERLNLDVFRIRQQFASAGVVDAAAIVERRPRTRQLRIGTKNVSITSL